MPDHLNYIVAYRDPTAGALDVRRVDYNCCYLYATGRLPIVIL